MIMMGDRKKAIAAILGPQEAEEHGNDEMGTLKTIAEELIECVHAKDPEGVAAAFKAAFAECESQPHEEYEESED